MDSLPGHSLTFTALARVIVDAYYQLGPVLSLVPYPGRRHVAKVDAHRGIYVLKEISGPAAQRDSIVESARLVRYLADLGFPTYEMVMTVDGQPFAETPAGIFELHTYVEGSPIGAISSCPSAVGGLIGTYHRLVRGYAAQIGRPADLRTSSRLLISGLLRRLTDPECMGQLRAFGQQLEAWLSHEALTQSWLRLHGDVDCSNIICTAPTSCGNSDHLRPDRAPLPLGQASSIQAQAPSTPAQAPSGRTDGLLRTETPKAGLYLIDFEDGSVDSPYFDLGSACTRVLAESRSKDGSCASALSLLVEGYKLACGRFQIEPEALAGVVSAGRLNEWLLYCSCQLDVDDAVASTADHLRRDLEQIRSLILSAV